MTRDEDPDTLIFGHPDPVLFSSDPDLDPNPTYNNGFMNFFHLEQNINQNQKFKLKIKFYACMC